MKKSSEIQMIPFLSRSIHNYKIHFSVLGFDLLFFVHHIAKIFVIFKQEEPYYHTIYFSFSSCRQNVHYTALQYNCNFFLSRIMINVGLYLLSLSRCVELLFSISGTYPEESRLFKYLLHTLKNAFLNIH